MTAYDDALDICGVLIHIIVLWVIIASPAFLQWICGDGTALVALEAQGFHWIPALLGVSIFIILLVGVWLD